MEMSSRGATVFPVGPRPDKKSEGAERRKPNPVLGAGNYFRGGNMTLVLQHCRGGSPFECRRIHPILVRGRRWLAVLRIGPWSLIVAERAR